MPLEKLSESNQNYLKAVYSLGEWSSEPVTASAISAKVGVKLSTTSDAIRKLAAQGLLHHEPYGAVTLTKSGRAHAISMVRRHRLIETFLVDVLHYRWDQVHDEAEVLEHAVSDLMIERLDALLQEPARDPHGDPIPRSDGSIKMPKAMPLSDVSPGSEVTVERVSDDDPGLLQYLADHDIQYGTRLQILPPAPYSDAITAVATDPQNPLNIGHSAAKSVWVSISQ